MTYPDGPGPYPQPGRAPGAPPPVQPSKAPRGNTWARLGVAATILAAAIGGGIIGSLLTNRADSTTADTSATTAADGAPTPEYVNSQDIKLCTEYALITVARPQPVTSDDLLPAVAAVRTSLAAYPEASADLRAALNDVVDSYFAEMSNLENRGEKGLVDPPKYDQAAVQATYGRAWAICGLK